MGFDVSGLLELDSIAEGIVVIGEVFLLVVEADLEPFGDRGGILLRIAQGILVGGRRGAVDLRFVERLVSGFVGEDEFVDAFLVDEAVFGVGFPVDRAGLVAIPGEVEFAVGDDVVICRSAIDVDGSLRSLGVDHDTEFRGVADVIFEDDGVTAVLGDDFAARVIPECRAVL